MAKTPRIAPSTSAATLLTFRQADLNPIGMIVSALLTEPQFQALNGASWVLLDGRSVAGSLYATTTGISTLPDARGLPLRGKNSGGSAQGARSDGVQNPDGDLALGTFQNDSMQGHNHQGLNIDVTAMYWLAGNAGTGAGAGLTANGSNYNGIRTNGPSPDSTNGTPRTGAETRMKNITVNHFIKINP